MNYLLLLFVYELLSTLIVLLALAYSSKLRNTAKYLLHRLEYLDLSRDKYEFTDEEIEEALKEELNYDNGGLR